VAYVDAAGQGKGSGGGRRSRSEAEAKARGLREIATSNWGDRRLPAGS